MKILMTLMGLEIGGAETHVVELSKALKNNGHEIIVASNGGIYQKELESNGIRHVKIPLHSKKPWLFVRSYFLLKKLFDKEDFDIVHAHARIPAYICGLLSKKYNFRFVTTAHWVFKITPLWKRLANWGEKTIAVSEDIKEYLIDNYNLWPDNITTTINGIDTVKFSKSQDWSDIDKEFSLGDDKYRILYVSRMDEDRSAVAYMVANAIPEIIKIKPNTQLVIVGDGNDFDRLKAHTDKINEEIGHRAIILTGGRIDINKFVAASDVFVGVSRSALEAMAAGLPVIIAGNEGYIGIFDETKFKVSYETNYCCRGCQPSTDKVISEDLLKLANYKYSQINSISEYNKSIINKFYSVSRMAYDYEAMYKTLTPLKRYKYANIIINGYYGYGNTGDEALLQAIIENIHSISPNARISVLSARPKETAERYNVNGIQRYNIFKIIKAFKRAELFISGGGSLLQDVTSTKSLFYYTSIIKLAKRYGLKVMVYANGFGPVNKDVNLKRVKSSLLCADYISMREKDSANALKDLMPDISVNITADPAFSLSSTDDKWSERILKKYNISKDKKYFAFSLREWQDNDADIIAKVTDYCKKIYLEHSLIPVFITMQTSKDSTIEEKIIKNLDFECILISDTTAKELISVMKEMTFAIGMRLHFLIFSIVASTPVIAISYDPKINSLMHYVGIDNIINSNKIDVDELCKITNSLLISPEITKSKLSASTDNMREKNVQDAKIAIDLTKKQ